MKKSKMLKEDLKTLREQENAEIVQHLEAISEIIANKCKRCDSVLGSLGYDVKPLPDEKFYDIVCSIRFGEKQKLIDFVQAIQYVSPVDSYVTPEPWAMPGYDDEVIMAAGCFVQGASIELSCDGPVRPPYIAYLQGGITFEHGIIALEKVLENLNK